MIDRLHVLHVPGADPERDLIVRNLQYETKVCLHLDPERKGIMPNWLSAVECAAKDGTKWSVIVQDDARPLPYWEQNLTEALLYSPEPVLGLTYFGSLTEGAVKKGIPYLIGPHLIWGGAVAYHQQFLRGLRDWAQMIYDETEYQHDDRLISAYAAKRGWHTALVTRAIFDQPVEKSLVGHGGSVRRPSITIDTKGPAQSVRWSALPRSQNKASSAAKDQRDWLATYGTPDQPTDHTFVKVRSGYVKRVAL